MKSGRIFKAIAVIATASLVVGAFAAVPAEAKKKKKKGCATYQPGTNGEGAPFNLVTDAATAEKPAALEVDTGPGLGIGRDPEGEGAHVSHAYANLQVDSAAPETTLFVQIEFTEAWDYDVYLDTSDGTEVANSAGFGNQTFGSEYAHSEFGSETIQAFPVNDCDGFTIDVVGATTPGETVGVKYWVAPPE